MSTCAVCDKPAKWKRWRMLLCDQHSEDPVVRDMAWHRLVAEHAPAGPVKDLHTSLGS